MLTFNDYRKVGCINKYFGNKNDFFIRFNEEYLSINDELLDYLFVQIDGYLVPFKIKSFKIDKKGMYVQFTDSDINNEKTTLINRNVFLHIDSLVYTYDEFSFKDLSGYCLFNDYYLKIGDIIDYFDIKGNPILLVKYNNQEIMIPFHKDIILSIDHNKKNVSMKIPDGLLNIE